MTMNLGSHLVSHWEMFKHLVVGDEESASATQDFYGEYRSVCDMSVSHCAVSAGFASSSISTVTV